ncbi:DUF2073 domain-containing protein [Candidatus Woesearchaeota archaeon]|jgi:hypothetical protein|nr:DUF2073 domain-containing protein [Candidatus Woesearchaeota archaeon]
MLTLQFMPYDEIANLVSNKRISKVLNIVKGNNILLLEGRLRKEEEAELIKRTMEEIDEDFKGIELGVIYPDEKKNPDFFNKIKSNMINLLLGDRRGFTIMGPATIVREIKQDPNKIQLFTNTNFKL